ncbi:HupE/UreJ family protein [Pararhodobacter sp. CCB-MM2]|uniref:HupE/UreJ family protein n=1 Tax=Pararhodobacter sp. CCB-MM2 TaxID=1786003 RepID=UPI0009F52128|nr:HupE/UreJ family protein [Pararhodobacter sp. CCB-MM2]
MKRISTALFLMALATPSYAHLPPEEHGSFLAGASHPWFGTDHILAMVAVGLWAALLGGRLLWQLPIAFVASMVLGFILALGGVRLPIVEPMILASVIALGLLTATAARLPAGVCLALCALFGLFHGHAHGDELGTAGAASFGIGFAVSTATLHALGVVMARASLNSMRTIRGTQLFGLLTTLAGLWIAVTA